jgi:hypothetical protein
MIQTNNEDLITKLKNKVVFLEEKLHQSENLRIELIQKLMNSENKERRVKKKFQELRRRLK